jgi:hypothetical protein
MALKRGLGNKRIWTGYFWVKIMVSGDKWRVWRPGADWFNYYI